MYRGTGIQVHSTYKVDDVMRVSIRIGNQQEWYYLAYIKTALEKFETFALLITRK